MLDLLDDRTGRRLDGGGEADVRLVDDTADAGVHLLVASLVERGELGEAFFEGALDLGLEGDVAGAGALDGGGEGAELLLELRPSARSAAISVRRRCDLGRHLIAELG